MPIVKLDPFIKEIHGKMGDVVFRRGPQGQTILSRAPRQLAKKGEFVAGIHKIQPSVLVDNAL